ncbi:hypothetical protein HPB50_025423 [Hyalomma asiaticum]|uniref:Uncharacterized protein n=1 Tax=Hyalomma asiaticum TaxID=266040 RepID=A0ACB7SI49_HYAAI|nr:hypothetical protein HPB50_025423 [Hyalomma asiaticum]
MAARQATRTDDDHPALRRKSRRRRTGKGTRHHRQDNRPLPAPSSNGPGQGTRRDRTLAAATKFALFLCLVRHCAAAVSSLYAR